MSLQDQLQHKIDNKTKPVGSLGKLETIALQVGLLQQTLTPKLTHPAMFTFAADHGLADAGVSPYPKEVTFQMVQNFLNEGAAINIFCKQHNINLHVVDAGVDADFAAHPMLIDAKIRKGTRNMLDAPAMTMEECQKALDKGARLVLEAAAQGTNVIGFGEMGIGNTSSASLLLSHFAQLPIDKCTGPGTGHTPEGVSKKIKILKQVQKKYTSLNSPMEALATLGGLEVAMMTGAFIEAAKQNMLILVDGFIASAACMTAIEMAPATKNACLFTHQSGEQGHKLMLDHLQVQPLLDLGMRLGEGTGAAVAYPLVLSAINFLNDMASFEDANVSNRED